MGLTKSSIYLDACIAIYLVEESSTFADKLETVLAANPDAEFCISALTEMECLINPLREQNEPMIQKFENWFQTTKVLSIESQVFRKAAQLRADFNSLKTPDALHLPTALHHNCDEFRTNDNRLNSVSPSFVKNVLIS